MITIIGKIIHKKRSDKNTDKATIEYPSRDVSEKVEFGPVYINTMDDKDMILHANTTRRMSKSKKFVEHVTFTFDTMVTPTFECYSLLVDTFRKATGFMNCPVKWVAHNNTKNKHIHIIVIRSHENDARTIYSSSFLKDKIQKTISIFESINKIPNNKNNAFYEINGKLFKRDTKKSLLTTKRRYITDAHNVTKSFKRIYTEIVKFIENNKNSNTEELKNYLIKKNIEMSKHERGYYFRDKENEICLKSSRFGISIKMDGTLGLRSTIELNEIYNDNQISHLILDFKKEVTFSDIPGFLKFPYTTSSSVLISLDSNYQVIFMHRERVLILNPSSSLIETLADSVHENTLTASLGSPYLVQKAISLFLEKGQFQISSENCNNNQIKLIETSITQNKEIIGNADHAVISLLLSNNPEEIFFNEQYLRNENEQRNYLSTISKQSFKREKQSLSVLQVLPDSDFSTSGGAHKSESSKVEQPGSSYLRSSQISNLRSRGGMYLLLKDESIICNYVIDFFQSLQISNLSIIRRKKWFTTFEQAEYRFHKLKLPEGDLKKLSLEESILSISKLILDDYKNLRAKIEFKLLPESNTHFILQFKCENLQSINELIKFNIEPSIQIITPESIFEFCICIRKPDCSLHELNEIENWLKILISKKFQVKPIDYMHSILSPQSLYGLNFDIPRIIYSRHHSIDLDQIMNLASTLGNSQNTSNPSYFQNSYKMSPLTFSYENLIYFLNGSIQSHLSHFEIDLVKYSLLYFLNISEHEIFKTFNSFGSFINSFPPHLFDVNELGVYERMVYEFSASNQEIYNFLTNARVENSHENQSIATKNEAHDLLKPSNFFSAHKYPGNKI